MLEATRPHIELYRCLLEEQGLAASTIDRRLSTVCGFYRFAHIDGRVASNPAQYVRRPHVHPSEGRGLDRSELGAFLLTAERYDHDHAALAVLLGPNGLRVSEACATNIEDLGIERGIGCCGSSVKATSRPRSRWYRARRAPSIWPSGSAAPSRSFAAATGSTSTDGPRTVGSGRSGSGQVSTPCTLTCFERRSSWPPSTPASHYETSSLRHDTPIPNHHRLRPATTKLRPTRRLRHRCLRHRRIGLTLVRALLPLISPPRLTALPNALVKAAPMFVRTRPPRTLCPRT